MPTVKEIEDMAKVIRTEVQTEYSEKAAKNIKILYGGSVNSQNAKIFGNIVGLNGLLVGGACLSAEEFAKICRV